MAIDVELLRIAKHRKDYNRLIGSVPKDVMDSKTYIILKDFGKYFEKFPSKESIEISEFLPRFKQWHKELNDESYLGYAKIMRTVQKDADEETKAGILGDIAELSLGTKLANIVNDYNQGTMAFPLGDMLTKAVDDFKLNMGARSVSWDSTPIEDLLQADLDDSGIKWRLQALNDCMRPLRPGDFGIIAARPDKGKTTFLTSEITYMASQLPEDKNVLWVCNEGMTGTIVKRLYQSALGCGISKMVRLSQAQKLTGAYEKRVGRRDRIRVVNAHGMHVGQVDALIEASNVGIVVYDMLDNIKGFEGEARTDRQLEEMYKWARERCVKYNCIGLATSQISNEGDDEAYPSLGMLKDSKTGKQGACDFQLMIGAKNDPMYDNVRFIGLPKNKLRREGAKGNPRVEVQYLPEISRYADIIETPEEVAENVS